MSQGKYSAEITCVSRKLFYSLGKGIAVFDYFLISFVVIIIYHFYFSLFLGVVGYFCLVWLLEQPVSSVFGCLIYMHNGGGKGTVVDMDWE